MYFTSNTLLSILAAASLTAANPTEKRADLQNWQLESLSTHSPSGRPGNYPWLTVTATVNDPNELTLGTSGSDNSTVKLPVGGKALNCQAKWISPDSAYGHRWPCDNTGATDGYWFMDVVEVSGGSPTNNFDLKFTRVAQQLYRGELFEKKYEGQAHFGLGADGNLAGSCGGSGVCNWGLKEEKTPFPIQQKEI
ncbi:hypothetical protein K469DRAFT_623417 [Zopfia rhizophila CBS 207.26]|uniref:Cell death in tomato 1 n=1 Tax=Zopfia rhizophila CBS 207.26 TaxID=1314779 RepID=A0A6A6EEB0_9PEZI|nr:hypothetical protein K469DRAFT_623417 [Zopfia rhizophila CBS 207.26]